MASRVLVKIEGLRDPAEAARIAEMGAEAIGLVFAPSPRRVTVEQARAVVAALPHGVATVGVFVDAAADEINDVAERTGIACVQLHGDEPPEIAAQLARPCIKAFRVRDERWAGEARAWMGAARRFASVAGSAAPERAEQAPQRERAEQVPQRKRAEQAPQRKRAEQVPPLRGFALRPPVALLDAYDPRAAGGTGRRFNWRLVAEARAAGAAAGIGPIILAGGLDASCVGEAIRLVRPWAVDVASGVESAPGVKDLAKVEAFLRAVREADGRDGASGP